MAKSYPDTIPEAYASCTYLADAYRRGWNHGHGIACHNVPELGKTYWTEGEGRITADADNIRDVHATLCHAAADNSRSYSPFEFTASEFNWMQDGGWFIMEDGEDPRGPFDTREEAEAEAEAEADGGEDKVIELPAAEEMWQAFEEGTADAIAADLAEYSDDDYGITAEDEDGEG